MTRSLMRAFLFVLVLFSFATATLPAPAESPERRAALKLCKQKYREATKGKKYLKSSDRKARVAAAREERRKCEELAPRH
ncbi:MAG TPA: hypothetical protein VNS63_08280 [Blastocatellia bacterium]|nr:hypothetical protein [Blastocatellia bacterium]